MSLAKCQLISEDWQLKDWNFIQKHLVMHKNFVQLRGKKFWELQSAFWYLPFSVFQVRVKYSSFMEASQKTSNIMEQEAGGPISERLEKRIEYEMDTLSL